MGNHTISGIDRFDVKGDRALCLGMIFSENRHPLFGIMACLGMIFSENRHPLFGIMACLGMIFSENRHPLFGIMP
jgi:hypothetical protein